MALQHLDVLRLGNEIVIEYLTLDGLAVPPALEDPDEVRLTLYEPSGLVKLDQVLMVKVTTHPLYPKGLYRYLWQSQVTDPVGTWQTEVYTRAGTAENYSLRENAFILVA